MDTTQNKIQTIKAKMIEAAVTIIELDPKNRFALNHLNSEYNKLDVLQLELNAAMEEEAKENRHLKIV
jgi:hypothetical protein